MIRSHTSALRAALMLVDFASAVVLFVLLAQIRFGDTEWEGVFRRATGYSWLVVLAYAALWVVSLWLRGLYRLSARWSIAREAADILTAAAVLAVGTFAMLYLARLGDVSRLFLLILFPAQAALTLASRLVLRRLFEVVKERGHSSRYVLVVGSGAVAQDFADRLEAHRELGIHVVGHLAEADTDVGVTRPVLGRVDDLIDVLHQNVIDEVAICLPVSTWSNLEAITRVCASEGRVVRIPMDGVGQPLEHGTVEVFDGRPVVSYVPGPDRALALLVKRAMDILVAVVGLIVLSPIIGVTALAIRLRDGPPVIFRQTRIGLHGRTFTLLKFRTMVPDAEARLAEVAHLNEVDGNAFKLSEDPRLTSAGGFLRRTSLDEIPQLWNVLRGDMSLVGPRPPLPEEVAAYDPWQRRRLSMKPGMTGLWQVEGRRDPVFDRWVQKDLEYIDRWSLWLDVVIILRTIPALITNPGR